MTRATQSGMQPKPVRWIGSSKADVSAFPEDVKRRVGGAIWEAQIGLKAPFAKPLKGLRAAYTIRFAGVVYVLHAFQKKSRSGIATPKPEMDLIERRLARAREDYQQWRRSQLQ